MHLLDGLFTTDRMREIFSDRLRLQRMLDFEAALARALAETGFAPPEVAAAVESKCKAELFDRQALAREAGSAGNVAIPMVNMLTSFVRKDDEKAAGFVHWGATSQDAIDTGLILQVREALSAIDAVLDATCESLAAVAKKHKRDVVAGRTWLQQGPPTTFGLKAAGWLAALERHRARLGAARKQALVLQFGGAVGTLAPFEERGLQVATVLAQELKLALPDLPWHGHRDRLAEVATTLGLLVGSLGKIARDISLMAQTEIGEVAEPAGPGRGGSSTMPHKRNPVGSAVVLAAAIRVPALVSTVLTAMVQEHERGLGGWHAEWETLPELFLLTAGALGRINEILEGLEIHPEAMSRNLGATHGLILGEAVAFALAKHVGKAPAHHIVERASRRAAEAKRDFRDVLMEDADVRKHLSSEEITSLLDPRNYLGSAEKMADAVLAARTKALK